MMAYELGRPPREPQAIAQLLDFSRETFDDDRTLLAVWPRHRLDESGGPGHVRAGRRDERGIPGSHGLRPGREGAEVQLRRAGLGVGGQGPDHQRVLAGGVQEYHPQIRLELKPEVLSGMVDFIPSLPRATGQWLAEHTAWPAVLVTDSAGPSGFLMRQIPSSSSAGWPSNPTCHGPRAFSTC
ncbi:hypothetical protein NKH18_24125 [Streptomyces sp. M10(2022)]